MPIDPTAGPPPGDGGPLPFGLVYEELRQLAHLQLRRRYPGQTLNTTALVHEAYLKLHDRPGVTPKDRAHFFALAARAMRFILVDYARARFAQKRGGLANRVTLDEARDLVDWRADELLALDEALSRLAAERERLARVVELRFFGGLTHEELAETLGISVRTAKRDWELARAWLHRTIHGEASKKGE